MCWSQVMNTNGIGFYHLNCEHGTGRLFNTLHSCHVSPSLPLYRDSHISSCATGESICEFSNSTDLSVYGLKTEGRFVTLCAESPERLHSCMKLSNGARGDRDKLLPCVTGAGGCATVIESLCSVLVAVAAPRMIQSTHRISRRDIRAHISSICRFALDCWVQDF